MPDPLRVVIGQDDVLLRGGIARRSQARYALDLIGERPEGVGYLLKERVGDLKRCVDAVTRVAGGGGALDPEVVGRMLGRRKRNSPFDRLSPRERAVLAVLTYLRNTPDN